MRTVTRALGLVALSLIAGACGAPAEVASDAGAPTEPRAKPGFDITRFSTAGNDWFETFHVEDDRALSEVLQAGEVTEDTRLLVTDTATGRLALLTDQMGYHHLAQGSGGGKDWMVSF
jgi:hypothetical protein